MKPSELTMFVAAIIVVNKVAFYSTQFPKALKRLLVCLSDYLSGGLYFDSFIYLTIQKTVGRCVSQGDRNIWFKDQM